MAAGLSGGPPATVVPEVVVLDRREQLAALAPEWRALTARATDPNVFQTFEWVDTWLDHFGGRDGVHVVTARRDGELVGVMPFVEMRAGLGGVAVRMFVPAGHEHGDVGGPLIGPDQCATVAEALIDHLERLVDRRTIVELVRIATDSAFAAALERRSWRTARMVPTTTAPCPRLDLRAFADPETELHRLTRRRGVLRLRRRMDEQHRTTFTANDPSPTAVDALVDLHLRNWESRTEQVAGLLATESTRAFVADVVERLDRAGHTRLARLDADGRPVALVLGYVVGNRYLAHKSGFDEEFLPFGPGNMILAEAMREALGEGVDVMDLGRGDSEYKLRWSNDVGHVVSSTLVDARLRRPSLVVRRALLAARRRRERD